MTLNVGVEIGRVDVDAPTNPDGLNLRENVLPEVREGHGKAPSGLAKRIEDEGHARRLTPMEARDLTDEVKLDAMALWSKLLRLYEGRAHMALGHTSWAAYCAVEFDMAHRQAYRMLDAARVVESVASAQLDTPPATESVARELVPILRSEPERVPEVWADVIELHGPKPTAVQVREAVKGAPDGPAAYLPDVLAGDNPVRTAVVKMCSLATRIAEMLDDRQSPTPRFEGDRDELLDGLATVTAVVTRVRRSLNGKQA